MLTADAEFRVAANAAYDAFMKQPPYLAYRSDVDVQVPALKQYRRISRAVEVRTKDDLAVLQDLPQGQNQLGNAFPLLPTFDALSYFRLDFRLGDPIRQHNPLTAVRVIQPLHFSDPVSHADVVATSLRNYYATYADDSNDKVAHIALQALPALTTNNTSDFYLHDVYVDLATNLPTRVVYDGPTTEFTVDYTTAYNDTWLIYHAHYQHTLAIMPLHLLQTTFTTESYMSAFTFPETPTDPRLR